MLQVEEKVSYELPKHYLPKIMAIIQSGCLDLKNEKAVLHFNSNGDLKIVEYSHKYLTN